jgi:hypothetical protein
MFNQSPASRFLSVENAIWERMAGIISPRDLIRGVRDWI